MSVLSMQHVDAFPSYLKVIPISLISFSNSFSDVVFWQKDKVDLEYPNLAEERDFLRAPFSHHQTLLTGSSSAKLILRQ